MNAEERSKRILVVGDVHGQRDKLAVLLDRLGPDPEQDRLVFLGDYLDRGPQSRQVLDLLLEVAREHPRAVFLLGNHEAALVRYEASRDPEDLRRLRRLGFEATLESYGVLPGLGLDFMPPEHRDFLFGLRRIWRGEGLVCFHAPLAFGADPEAAGEEALEDLLSLLELKRSTDMFFLDAPIAEEEEQRIISRLGDEDSGFEAVEHRDWIDWVYKLVTPEEKKLLTLRYERRLGQRETARQMGVSQMQVSRMERRVLSRLRGMERQ